MWTDAMTGHFFGGLWQESRIVHQLKVIEVRQITIVLERELRLWKIKRHSEQLRGQLLLKRLDQLPVVRQNGR